MFMKNVKLNERFLFAICDLQGRKLLSLIGLNFSHLNERKFRHTQHFFLRFIFRLLKDWIAWKG